MTCSSLVKFFSSLRVLHPLFRPIRLFSSTMNETEVEVLYDGSCGLCRREIALLRKTTIGSNESKTRFINIATREFDFDEKMKFWKGQVANVDDLMKEMHVFDVRQGIMYKRVAAFRHLYIHLGAPKFLIEWTSKPPFDRFLDSAYQIFLNHIRPVLSSYVSRM